MDMKTRTLRTTLAMAIGISSLVASAIATADIAPPRPQAPAAPAARAAGDAAARAVAARVQSFYDQIQTLEARFHQTYFNKLYNNYQRSHGRVVFRKPGKMYWQYDEPNGKILVSDGQRILAYEPGDPRDAANPNGPREPGQVVEIPMANSELPAALSFLTGTGRLEDQFNFRLLDAAQQGFAAGDVLELRPKRPTPHYEKVLFYVSRREAGGRVAGIVERVLIIDHAGNRNRFDFQRLNWSTPQADEALFRWQPPAGTRRVAP